MSIQPFRAADPPLRGDAEQFDARERARVRAAALHARRVYPGRLGELVHRELVAYADFGYRFVTDALIPQLVGDILRTPAAGEATSDAEQRSPLRS